MTKLLPIFLIILICTGCITVEERVENYIANRVSNVADKVIEKRVRKNFGQIAAQHYDKGGYAGLALYMLTHLGVKIRNRKKEKA